MALYHASCVELNGKGILIFGPSGSGKSDLTLRLIDAGAKLVSDDYVELKNKADIISAHTAPNIEGLIEVRGVGLVGVDFLKSTQLFLALELTAREKIARLPDDHFFQYEEGQIPLYKFDCFSVSAVVKIKTILNR